MAKPDQATVEGWLREVQSLYSLFKSEREKYDEVLHRTAPPSMDERLGRNVAHYQSNMAGEAEAQIATIVTNNPTRFAAQPGAKGTRALDAIRDNTLIAARTWADEDAGGWLDKVLSREQCRYGVGIVRMLYHKQEEPDTDDLDEREAAYQSQPWPFFFEIASVLAGGWLRRGLGHDVYVAEYEVPLLAAQRDYKVAGGLVGQGKGDYMPTVDDTGKLGWLAASQAIGGSSVASGLSRKLKVVVAEWRDYDSPCPVCEDKHPLWRGIEIVRGASEQLSDGVIVQEYSLPYRYAGSYRVVGAQPVLLETDPHYAYPPLNLTLLNDMIVMDWAWSTIQTLANRDSTNDVYAKLSSLPKEMIESGAYQDELNAMLAKGWPKPEPGSKRIAFLPDLERFPDEISKVLWDVFLKAEERAKAAMPSRWLTGQNYEEAAQGTGTANLMGQQASGRMYQESRDQIDEFIRQAKEDQLHALKVWGQDEGKLERKYWATCAGDEQVRGAGADAGERVCTSASKLAYDFRLQIVTRAETLQEQRDRYALAYERFDRGYSDLDQLLEDLDYNDIDGQKRRLAKRQLQTLMAGDRQAMMRGMLRQVMTTVYRVDPALLGLGAPPAPPTPDALTQVPGQQPPRPYPGINPTPTIRLPSLAGAGSGGNPVGGMG